MEFIYSSSLKFDSYRIGTVGENQTPNPILSVLWYFQARRPWTQVPESAIAFELESLYFHLFPIALEKNLLARLFQGQQSIDGPRLKGVAGRYIGVLEGGSMHKMRQCFIVLLNRVPFRVVPPDPGCR